jgi:hypothetical protein
VSIQKLASASGNFRGWVIEQYEKTEATKAADASEAARKLQSAKLNNFRYGIRQLGFNVDDIELTSFDMLIDDLHLRGLEKESHYARPEEMSVHMVTDQCKHCKAEVVSLPLDYLWQLGHVLKSGRYGNPHHDEGKCLEPVTDSDTKPTEPAAPTFGEQLEAWVRDIAREEGGCQCQH